MDGRCGWLVAGRRRAELERQRRRRRRWQQLRKAGRRRLVMGRLSAADCWQDPRRTVLNAAISLFTQDYPSKADQCLSRP
jgi:hypothetical protein